MKHKLIKYLSVFMFISCQGFALTIHQVTVSAVSDQTIKIALDTEGEELYYFSSWQYNIDENMIVIEACFIPGFGSAIAYLNNNFEIPINTTQAQNFRLRVKVFYDSFQKDNLQDFRDGSFAIPIPNDVVLTSKSTNRVDKSDIFFANPSDGTLYLNHEVKEGLIYDEMGRFVGIFPEKDKVIDMSNLANGCYLLYFHRDGRHKTVRIILQKK